MQKLYISTLISSVLIIAGCTPEPEVKDAKTELSPSADTILIFDKTDNEIKVFQEVSSTSNFSQADDKIATSVTMKAKLPDLPMQIECVRFHVTDGATGNEACGVHCQDGETHNMECSADIFEDGFEVEYTE